MFNFIICDNDTFFLQKLKETIKNNITEYESIRIFKEYSNSFFQVVNDDSIQNKFYILDIETVLNNGIIIASKIREIDRNSIIIFLTGYEMKYSYPISKSRLRYDALINKFDNYEKELFEVISENKKYINKNRRITINVNSNTTYTIELEELYYIKTEKETQRLIFQIKEQKINTYEVLSNIEKELNDDFIKVSRSCIINKTLAKIDYKNNIIQFENGVILDNIMSQTFINMNKK